MISCICVSISATTASRLTSTTRTTINDLWLTSLLSVGYAFINFTDVRLPLSHASFLLTHVQPLDIVDVRPPLRYIKHLLINIQSSLLHAKAQNGKLSSKSPFTEH